MSDEAAPLGISPAAWAKFDRGLQRELATQGTAELPVLIRLAGPVASVRGSGPEAGESAAREFAGRASALLDALKRLGARDIREFWINSTVGAALPVAALGEIGARDDVAEILLMQLRKVAL